MRIRAYHADSGSVLVGEVTDWLSEKAGNSYRLIPDGLLESVVIRVGIWQVTELSEERAIRNAYNDGALAGMRLGRDRPQNDATP